MEKLKEGIEQIYTLLMCPHCKNEEYVPDVIQPDQFECLHVSPKGKIRAWCCKACKLYFYTEIRI